MKAAGVRVLGALDWRPGKDPLPQVETDPSGLYLSDGALGAGGTGRVNGEGGVASGAGAGAGVGSAGAASAVACSAQPPLRAVVRLFAYGMPKVRRKAVIGIEQHATRQEVSEDAEPGASEDAEPGASEDAEPGRGRKARRQWRCHPGPKVCRCSCCGEHARGGGTRHCDWLVAQPIWIGS